MTESEIVSHSWTQTIVFKDSSLTRVAIISQGTPRVPSRLKCILYQLQSKSIRWAWVLVETPKLTRDASLNWILNRENQILKEYVTISPAKRWRIFHHLSRWLNLLKTNLALRQSIEVHRKILPSVSFLLHKINHQRRKLRKRGRQRVTV